MQKRMSTLIACIAAVVALLAFAAVPAFAHHKDGHENGPDKTSEENFQEADQASSEEATEESTSEAPAEESSTTTASRESSTTTRAPGPNPDPEPSQAPPSTKGPGCTAYSGSEGGPYDHDNCDNSQGQHGGGGNDKCAGCTGKSDDKGPGGQAPGDHNNGYECDHNGGVGKGNPAHSRCPRPPPSITNLCPPGTDLAGLPPGTTGCDIPPNELCPAGTDMAGRPPGPDGCNDLVEGRTDNVCPEGTDLAGENMTELENCVLGTRFTQSGPKPPLGAILPFTGAGGIYSIAAIGLLLIAAGLINLRLRKQV